MEVEKGKMGFEETELRLGLPGNNNNNIGFFNGGGEVARKRGFFETVDLKLNLSSNEALGGTDHPNDKAKLMSKDKTTLLSADPTKLPAKAQVVGWPPVRSFRRNMLAEKKNGTDEGTSHEKTCGNILIASFVKVSMDGAPYLRKVDLKMYNSYKELSDALSNMFSSFTIGNCGADGMKDFMNVSKLVDLLNGTDYVPTYEDKDGDWMLLGDVPWKMFIGSCKRLRIMKGTEATGLAPKAMEKCKNRS